MTEITLLHGYKWQTVSPLTSNSKAIECKGRESLFDHGSLILQVFVRHTHLQSNKAQKMTQVFSIHRVLGSGVWDLEAISFKQHLKSLRF